ncbi:MFS transporter [Bacillaceae bacterium W0354]
MGDTMFSNQLADVDQHEKRNLLLLLLIGGLYTLGIFLSNIFVNIFLWKQSGEISVLTSYNLSIYVTQTLVFIFIGKLVKRIDRVVILRSGIFVISLFFISVLILSSRASQFHYVLGILIGAGYGLFWLSYNILIFEVTEPYTRDFFNSMFGALQSLSGMVGPLSAGGIITLLGGNKGYLTIFFISFVLFFIAIIFSSFLERREVEGNYHIKEVINERKNNYKWKHLLRAHLFQGIREGVFLFLVGIWVFIGTESEWIIGVYNFLYALCSFVAYQLVAKFVQPHNRKVFIITGSIFLFGSIFWLLGAEQPIEFYIYSVVVGLSLPFFLSPFTSISYDVIGKARMAREYRVEYIIFRDIILNLGRTLSVLLFLIGLWLFQEENWIKYGLIIFGSGYLLTSWNIHLITKSK